MKKKWDVEKEKEFNIRIQLANGWWDVNGMDEATKVILTGTAHAKIIQLLETKMVLEGDIESHMVMLKEAESSHEAVQQTKRTAEAQQKHVLAPYQTKTEKLKSMLEDIGNSGEMGQQSFGDMYASTMARFRKPTLNFSMLDQVNIDIFGTFVEAFSVMLCWFDNAGCTGCY